MGVILVRLRGFKKLTSVEEAFRILLNNLNIRSTNRVKLPLHLSLNRVLAEDVIATENLPRFDRSAVDGFAVRAEDTFETSQFKPRILKLTSADEVKHGEAKQVWTGNPLPRGANAVVMLENVRRLNGEIEVLFPVAPGENVSKKGEDVAKGQVAVRAGTRLRPHHLGMIASLGIKEITVYEKPKVAILATGNELVEIGQPIGEGQVFDVNRLILSSLCLELGAEPLDLGIARDDVEDIVKKLKIGLSNADIVITTGGTSVGASDLVPLAVNNVGEPGVLVHGIAMRPAMPTALAAINGKPIFILSGNPVAAIFGFEVFVRPLILKMSGLKEEPRPIITAKLTRRISSALGRKTFVRVRVCKRGNDFLAEPISSRGSGLLSTMIKSNGYIVIPENREGMEAGEIVQVHLFDTLEVVE
ncbi:MAG: molybdopterin molybdotransferase MoeA [Candidatus Bathyarchaeia archaeon]